MTGAGKSVAACGRLWTAQGAACARRGDTANALSALVFDPALAGKRVAVLLVETELAHDAQAYSATSAISDSL